MFKSCENYVKMIKYFVIVIVWIGGFFNKKFKWGFKFKFVWFLNEGVYSVLVCYLIR